MNEISKTIVKSTAPLLKDKGEEITTLMYEYLFSNHLEAKSLFKNASPDQYIKLANMVYAYASNIDQLENLQKGIEKVAQIHVATKIQYDYCMVFEAAGVNDEVVVGRKGVGTFFIDIKGKAAHAGNHYTDGADANLEAAQKLLALVALTNLDKQTTVNVGKLSGGIGANTISPKAKLTFELRYTTTDERDRVLKAVDEIVAKSYVNGTVSELSGGIQRDVMQPSPEQTAFVEKINNLCGITLPTEKRGGVSDANIIAAQGVATLDGWGPFGDGDHTIHERASKKSFEERIALVTQIFGHFLNGKI